MLTSLWFFSLCASRIFHCHIQPHLSSGLAAVFIEAPEMIGQRLSIDSAQLAQCSANGISTTGNAGGLNSTTDFGTLPKEVPFLEVGWNAKAVGSVVGCAITAFIGLCTVLVYGFGGEKGEREGEEEAEDDDDDDDQRAR